jgi:hypothetical protein
VVCLEKFNATKEEAQKESNRMKAKVTGKPIMKGAKHIIRDGISNTILNN